MDRYIGLDAHAASCTLAIVSEAGKRLRDFPVETNGAALVEAVRAVPGHRHLIFEEGTQSAWLYETLARHVQEIVVTGVTRSRGPKSDRVDAYALAEKLRTNAVDKPVFKAPSAFTRLRELARVHEMLVRDVVRVQARLKYVYRSRAVSTTGTALYSQSKRDQWQGQLPEASRAVTTKLYAHYDFLLALKKQAEQELVVESHRSPIARILETAPGIGPIRAARLLPIVVTPHRFRTKRQFWSYCGLGIVMRSSSDWVRNDVGQWQRAMVAQTRGLSKKHNHTLKTTFKGAATSVIQQGKPAGIYADYERLLESGTKPNLAKLTMARKIAAIVLHMWKEKEVYRDKTVNKEAAVRAVP
jgi:transposase